MISYEKCLEMKSLGYPQSNTAHHYREWHGRRRYQLVLGVPEGPWVACPSTDEILLEMGDVQVDWKYPLLTVSGENWASMVQGESLDDAMAGAWCDINSVEAKKVRKTL